MKEFFNSAVMENHPLRVLNDFLEKEIKLDNAGEYSKMRFVGYVLEIGYDIITIITSDPFKIEVGGVPRNSLLIMVPHNFADFPPHFTILRVLESAPTPLSKEVQQTYFELQKKSMPELDIFTQSELQWGALKTEVLGMIYPHPEKIDRVEFSGDLNNFVSAHKYRVYAPNDKLLNLMINSMVPNENRFPLGNLRLTECRLPLPGKTQPKVTVFVSTKDFMGTRTAMFGKTRLGKSNVIKLIAESLIETTKKNNNVGQLIFDINGEYANDNPQDDSCSIRSVYKDRCQVYALTEKPETPSRPLRLNFYEQPAQAHRIIGSLLRDQRKTQSAYVNAFVSVDMPSVDEVQQSDPGSGKYRSTRKIQLFWTILRKAGYQANEDNLQRLIRGTPGGFNPGFSSSLRNKVYSFSDIIPTPSAPRNLTEMLREFEIFAKYRRENPDIKSTSGNDLFDESDIALLEFLAPSTGRAGTTLIQPYRLYHDQNAGDFINEILRLLDEGKTVILDLGNANEEVRNYFSDNLSYAVFNHQIDKFTSNNLGNHYVQLYFEEAHNLFPRNEDVTTIYSRFAKEGAKYHIGMVYSTQSPTTINKDLLAQTENFFIAHLSSQDEVSALAKMNVAYESLKSDILQAKTVGYVRMLTRSHRFVVSVQARKFKPHTSSKED